MRLIYIFVQRRKKKKDSRANEGEAKSIWPKTNVLGGTGEPFRVSVSQVEPKVCSVKCQVYSQPTQVKPLNNMPSVNKTCHHNNHKKVSV